MDTIYGNKSGEATSVTRTIAIDSNMKFRKPGKEFFKKGLLLLVTVAFGLLTAGNKALAQTACSGTPNPGNTVASVNPVCIGGSTTLSLQNSPSGTGIIYNWQSSTDGSVYTNVGPYIMNNATFASTPANMTVYGNAAVSSGVLQLTSTVNGQAGGAVISTTPGSNITPFTAVFDYRLYDGASSGADGISLSYASNIANDAGLGEVGEGSGIILMLDTYDNPNNLHQSQIRINYNGSQVYSNTIGSFDLRSSSNRTVRLSVDGNGYLSLSIASTVFVSNLLLTGYAAADKSNWKFKFSGRTGIFNDNQTIDNVTILMGSGSTLSQSLSSTTYYKCTVTCANSIANASSSALQVMTTPSAVGGAAAATNSSIPSGTNTSIALTGYTGAIQWQLLNESSTWVDVTGGSGATTATYTTPTLTQTTYYRALVSSGLCSTATSTTTSVTALSLPSPPTNVTATPSVTYPGGYVGLNATSTGNQINWYETATGGTSFITVNSGETLNWPPASSTTYYAEAMIPAVTADVTLNNTSSAVCNGVFFDITPKPAKGAITIDGFPFSPNGSSSGEHYRVYYRSGSYAGHETDSLSWTFLGGYTTTGSGANFFMDISDLTIPANTTYGFYIYFEYWELYYDANPASSSNSDASITIAGSKRSLAKWDGIANGTFKGSVRYNSQPARMSSSRTSVAVTITQAPSTQASQVVFNGVQQTQMGISWTKGNGSRRVVFICPGTFGSSTPSLTTTYAPNTIYGQGSSLTSTDYSGPWYCIYNGTGTSVTVTGLQVGTTYRVHVCEYNGNDDAQVYNTTTATGNPATQLTAFNSATWDGSESTDWFEPLNWTPETYPDASANLLVPNIPVQPLIISPEFNFTTYCNNLTIEYGAVLTIGETGRLTVNGTLTNQAGVGGLVVNSGGSLIEHSGAVATVKRNIPTNEWHLISAPISNAKAGIFEGYYLQKHDEYTNVYSDITLVNEDLSPMQGYALYGSAGVSPAVFSGALNAGENSYVTSFLGEGWNLIGNPYPSSIDWNSSGIIKTNIESATYCHVTYSILEEDNFGWASFIDGTGTNGGTQYIAPCQGFFVKAINSTGSITMNNAARLHNATTFFKNANSVPNLIRLEVSGNGYKDEAVVRFVDEATAEFDGNYDAHKLFGESANAAQVYTTGTGQLSINSLPETNMVPVGVKIGSTGNYTIAATEINDMPYATLEDTKTGIFTELAKGPYTFNFTSGEDELRFKLHFSALSVNEDKASDISIYSYHKTAYINLKNQLKGDIYICNMAGQLITSRETATGLVSLGINAPGIYIVKVVSDKETTTAKIFIQ